MTRSFFYFICCAATVFFCVAYAVLAVPAIAGCTASIIPFPNIPGVSLSSVAGTSIGDVWAVGTYLTLDYTHQIAQRGLIMHFDGARWTIVPSPHVRGVPNDYLVSVSAASSRDVWAGGYTQGRIGVSPLIEHWDGAAWTISQGTPVKNDNTYINAISASPRRSSAVWAVGVASYNVGCAHPVDPLAEGWNGQSWFGAGVYYRDESAEVTGVAAMPDGHAWLIGYSYPSYGTTWFIDRYNGSGGFVHHSPLYPDGDQFTALSASGDDDVWLATANAFRPNAPHLKHWDGHTWSVFPDPFPKYDVGYLSSPAKNDLWLVSLPGVKHWDGISWSVFDNPPGYYASGIAGLRGGAMALETPIHNPSLNFTVLFTCTGPKR